MGIPEPLQIEQSVDEIVQTHMKLVHRLARRFRWAISGSVDYQDLVSEGVVGLLKAIKRYDSGRGVKFATFAIPWVMNGIRRFIQEKGSAIRTPQKVYQRTGSILKFGLHGASISTVSAMIGCSEKQARESLLYLHNSKIAYLDMPLPNTKSDSDATLADTLALKEDGTMPHVEAFIHMLEQEERQLLELRLQQSTLNQISRELLISAESIIQMLAVIGEKWSQFMDINLEREVICMELTKEKYIHHKKVDDLPDSKISTMYAMGSSALQHRKERWGLVGSSESRCSSARGVPGSTYSEKNKAKLKPDSKAEAVDFEKASMEVELDELRKEVLTLREFKEWREKWHQTETMPLIEALQKENGLLKALLKNYL